MKSRLTFEFEEGSQGSIQSAFHLKLRWLLNENVNVCLMLNVDFFNDTSRAFVFANPIATSANDSFG